MKLILLLTFTAICAAACPVELPKGYHWVLDKHESDRKYDGWRLFDANGESFATATAFDSPFWTINLNPRRSGMSYFGKYESLEAAKCRMARYLKKRKAK